MPRLTPMLRIAFALASLPVLLFLLIILGAYGIGPVTVTGDPPSNGFFVVGLVVGVVFVAFLGLAITGWNPLHRVDVAMAKMRTESEDRSPASRAGTTPPSPRKFIVVLVVVSLGFAALKLIETSVFSSSFRHAEWSEWRATAGFFIALFWFGIFVVVSRDREWFGGARRLIHAFVLAGAVFVGIWLEGSMWTDVHWWVAGAFALGLFAEKWVNGL